MNDTVASAKQRLEEVLAFFEVNVDVAAQETEDGIELDVPASNITPRLIGRHGETLHAVEYLVNQMVKHGDAEAPRVLIDVAGYKKARRNTLEEQAQEVARRVIETGEPEELKPMNPAERRIVHMALRELPEIATESHGEGRDRRIVIKPAA